MYGQRHQHQPVEATSFPLMSVNEICECLSALNIPVQQEDIIKPSAASAQHIYANLVSEIMGAPIELIEQPKSALLGMLEYKELYSDALGMMMFFRHA
jgi:kinetochore protein Nuf2